MAVPPSKTQRTCSQCGNNGHNARTCIDSSGGSTGFMLFGVRLTAAEGLPTSPPMLSAFRKTVSMSNLSQYEHQPQGSSGNVAADVDASGYASDDAIHASGSRRNERKRGTPWTEEEHKLFLMGLKKVGKGDWRGISKNFVKTRTPTQVASHAQKYFIRRSNVSRRRRRSSLFDITTDAVATLPIEEQSLNQDSASKSILFPKPTKLKQSCPVPPSAKMANLNLNQSPSPSSSSSTTSTRERELEPVLSLKLPSDEGSVPRASVFGEFNSNGDSIISVA